MDRIPIAEAAQWAGLVKGNAISLPKFRPYRILRPPLAGAIPALPARDNRKPDIRRLLRVPKSKLIRNTPATPCKPATCLRPKSTLDGAIRKRYPLG